jgi:hypothetical protein
MVSFDRLPYIGQLTPVNRHLHIATDMSLWEMSKGKSCTGSTVKDLDRVR